MHGIIWYTRVGAVSYGIQELVQYHTVYKSWCSIILYTRVGAWYHTVYKSWCRIIRYTIVGAVSYGIQELVHGIIRYTRVGAVSYCIQEMVQYHTVNNS